MGKRSFSNTKLFKNLFIVKMKTITLIGIDCVNIDRLLKAFNICLSYNMNIFKPKILTHFEVQNNDIEIVKIPKISDIKQYSYFIINSLVDYIDTEFCLIIQYDGYILNPKAWTADFLKYDYIGAPWRGTKKVGNGGFSLRSKKFLKITSKLNITDYHPEDAKLCNKYRQKLIDCGIEFAPFELANKFSIEGGVWDCQFGFHNPAITKLHKWKKV